MKFFTKIPVFIRFIIAGFVILSLFIYLVWTCFFSSGMQPDNNTVISREASGSTQPEQTASTEQDGNVTNNSATNTESYNKETVENTERSPYLLSGQTLDMAAAQLGTSAFRMPFTLKDVPCEYVAFDNRPSLPDTVTPGQLHTLTVCINNSYFTFQIYTDTECVLEEAQVTGVSESGDSVNPDHLYLPNGIFVGESTDTLAGFSVTGQFLGTTTHRYQDSLGQRIVVYSKNGTITSTGIYAPE
ncbi:MAG: hypothetical protein IJN92_08675 [Lachnospiraceae bacterium]|nr:hypothetical protein [Lachnospiraceae bacterium]